MMTLHFPARLVVLFGALWLSACGMPPPPPDQLPPVRASEVAALTRTILALGPHVDPEEAARAAEVALTYPRKLAVAYEITDPPYLHNIKVNQGKRPRGLCYQWADDMEARLRQEQFRTLTLHRAIANSDNPLRIEHSTVIVSAAGDTMWEGIVLDPWRNGGILYWGPVLDDHKYPWKPRQQVFDEKRRLSLATAAR
ncbi:hypothetical protein [Salipiger sp.]|uniref:hypothetical protein n=1 Tax=Salipiger sp. TaxID=2078585 RepID=UPI003A96B419